MKIRDRIIGMEKIPVGELRKNERNWRDHPKEQSDALADMLAKVGFAGALLSYDDPEYGLTLIDGHLRTELAEENKTTKLPVLLTDLTREESDMVLATFDPIGSMAKADNKMLNDLLVDVGMKEPSEEHESTVEDWDVGELEIPVWVVVRAPLSVYGKIEKHLQDLRKIEGVDIDTSI